MWDALALCEDDAGVGLEQLIGVRVNEPRTTTNEVGLTHLGPVSEFLRAASRRSSRSLVVGGGLKALQLDSDESRVGRTPNMEDA